MSQKKYFKHFLVLFQKIQNFKKKLNKTKLLFKQNLIKQFTKFISKDDKYSSGIYGKIEGIFLEIMQYKSFFERIFGKNFNIQLIFLYIKPLQKKKKKNSIKIFFIKK